MWLQQQQQQQLLLQLKQILALLLVQTPGQMLELLAAPQYKLDQMPVLQDLLQLELQLEILLQLQPSERGIARSWEALKAF